MSQGFTRNIPVDTDGTLAANSDQVIPSQKAVKTYVDSSGGGSGTVNSGSQYRIPYYSTNPSGTTLDAAAAITASRALKSDANGVPTHFDTTTEPSLVELAHVKGVTSAIQTQINNINTDNTYPKIQAIWYHLNSF